MIGTRAVTERAAALRFEFDAQFGAAPRDTRECEDFLLVQAGGLPYALRLAQVGGVTKSTVLAPAPSRRPELLGLAGFRGRILCVYGMATLLGGAEDAGSNSWLALSGGDDSIAVAFEKLEAFARVDRARVHVDSVAESGQSLLKGVVETEPAARPVVDLARMFAVVRRSADSVGPGRRDP